MLHSDKVCIPQAEGVDILELGTLVNDFFLPWIFRKIPGGTKQGNIGQKRVNTYTTETAARRIS